MPESPAGLPPQERRIFCNRTLNFRSIGAVGYDMDYTLVHYRVEDCDRAMIRLCAELGVPIAIATDSHRSHEFGDFSYHERLLAEEGLAGGDGLLLTPEACERKKGRNLFPT